MQALPKPLQRSLAFVIHDLNAWGGHDRSTLEIARRLSHRWPVDVYAYTLADPLGLDAWGTVRFHRVRPNVQHPFAAKLAWFYAMTYPQLRLLPRMTARPAPLIHATGTCTWVSDVVQVQFINAAWKQREQRLPEGVCARPYARGTQGPIAWARNLYHEKLLDHHVWTEHKVYTKDRTYIAIARSVADELREMFGITERVHVIHHGVDSKLFAPAAGAQLAEREGLRRKLGVTPEELLIAFVGAYERKGLAVAIDSLAALSPAARARAKLMAVGGGAAHAFQERARKLGIEDRLVLAGHTRDVPSFYRASDLFLLPTLYEPFGLVVLEAMACGLPPVVSRLAGASELIRDGVSGTLIDDPADATEVARRLEPLLLDDRLRARMSMDARQAAQARSWDHVAEEYAQVLAPLLQQEPRPHAVRSRSDSVAGRP